MGEEKFNQILIEDWMIKDLRLKNADLLIYAMIYNATECFGGCKYKIRYMSQLSGYTKAHVYKILERLEKLKLIRIEDPGKRKPKIYYSTTRVGA